MSALANINTNQTNRKIEERGIPSDTWGKVSPLFKEEGGPGFAPPKDGLKATSEEKTAIKTLLTDPSIPKHVAFRVLTKIYFSKPLLQVLDESISTVSGSYVFNHKSFARKMSMASRHLKGMLMHLFNGSNVYIHWYLKSYAALKREERETYYAAAKDFTINLSKKTGKAYAKKFDEIDLLMVSFLPEAHQTEEKSKGTPVSEDSATTTGATTTGGNTTGGTTAGATTTDATTTDTTTTDGTTTGASATGGTTTSTTAVTMDGATIQVITNEAGEMTLVGRSLPQSSDEEIKSEIVGKYGLAYLEANPDLVIGDNQTFVCNPAVDLKHRAGAGSIPPGIIYAKTWLEMLTKLRRVCFPLYDGAADLIVISKEPRDWEIYQALVFGVYLRDCFPSRWKELARAVSEYGQAEEAKIASLTEFKFSPDQLHVVFRVLMGNTFLIESLRRIFQNHPTYRQHFDKVIATLESMLSGTRAQTDTSGVAITTSNTAAQEVRVNILNNLERMFTDTIIGTIETGFHFSHDSLFGILKRCVIESFDKSGSHPGDRIDHLADKLAQAFRGQLSNPLLYKFASFVNVYFVLGETGAHGSGNSCDPSAVKDQLINAFSPATLGNPEDIRKHVFASPAMSGLFYLMVVFAWSFSAYKKLTPAIDASDAANTLTETLNNMLRTLEEKAGYYDLILNNSGAINSATHETEMIKNNSDITKLTRTTGTAINRLYVLRVILEDQKLPHLAVEYNYNGVCKKRGDKKVIDGLRDEYIDLCIKNRFDNKLRKEDDKKNNHNNNNDRKTRNNNDDANRRGRSPDFNKKGNNNNNKKKKDPEEERDSTLCPHHRCSKVQESTAAFGGHTAATCRYKGTGMIFKWNPYKFNPRTQEKGIWEYDIGAMRLALKKPSLKFSDVKKMDNDIKAKWKKSKQNKKNADAAEENDGKPEDAAEE